eukprot:1115243-Rhodomonas_salina.1
MSVGFDASHVRTHSTNAQPPHSRRKRGPSTTPEHHQEPLVKPGLYSTRPKPYPDPQCRRTVQTRVYLKNSESWGLQVLQSVRGSGQVSFNARHEEEMRRKARPSTEAQERSPCFHSKITSTQPRSSAHKFVSKRLLTHKKSFLPDASLGVHMRGRGSSSRPSSLRSMELHQGLLWSRPPLFWHSSPSPLKLTPSPS